MKHPSLRRRGVTLTELVVSASLLLSAMAIVAPLAVRSTQLWQDTRRQHLVIDELSGQLERLIHLDPIRRDQAIASLQPSDYIQSTLPSAELEAKVIRDESGARIVVSLDWDRLGDPQPVSLVGWLDPISDKQQAEEVNSAGVPTHEDTDKVSS